MVEIIREQAYPREEKNFPTIPLLTTYGEIVIALRSVNSAEVYPAPVGSERGYVTINRIDYFFSRVITRRRDTGEFCIDWNGGSYTRRRDSYDASEVTPTARDVIYKVIVSLACAYLNANPPEIEQAKQIEIWNKVAQIERREIEFHSELCRLKLQKEELLAEEKRILEDACRMPIS